MTLLFNICFQKIKLKEQNILISKKQNLVSDNTEPIKGGVNYDVSVSPKYSQFTMLDTPPNKDKA